MLHFKQYEEIMSYDKSDSRFSSNGPLSLHKNTPYIYVKHLGHNVKKGDQLVIEKSSNLNRINRSDINKKHIVKVGDTYKIHARVIYPYLANIILKCYMII